VGERGVTLSGGQKQRAAIARMLLQHTPIMVFDDSLSAVDAETDSKIRTALRSQMKDATCIMISHRISTLMEADQIIVMGRGKILERGTHQELLAQQGIYKKIYDLQLECETETETEVNQGEAE
jgi:ATP-binding cassette subfamily B protein